MTKFAFIPKNFNPDHNFWDYNPQHKIIKPFSELYKKLGEEKSSKIMWVCTFMRFPDEEKNKMYNLSDEEKKESISDYYYPKFDWNDKLFVKCLEAYPSKCMSDVQRMLYEKRKNLMERTKILDGIRENIIKENDVAKKLKLLTLFDKCELMFKKLLDDLKYVENLYKQEQIGSRVHGGRQKSFSEMRKV